MGGTSHRNQNCSADSCADGVGSAATPISNGRHDRARPERQKPQGFNDNCAGSGRSCEGSASVWHRVLWGVLKPLFEGVRVLSNKPLSAYLKAVGCVIPLMDHDSADAFSSGACTRLIMPILIREFSSPDDDMKRVVLTVLTQCVKTEGVEAAYVRDHVLPEFLSVFGCVEWHWTDATTAHL